MNRRHFLHQLTGATASAFTLGQTAAARTLYFAGFDDLMKHRIADVRYTEAQLKWPRFVGKNARRDIHGYGPKVTVCTLTTDQGAKGWGLPNGRRSDELITYVKGKRVADLFRPDMGVTDPRALAFDVPLHDLAGVILNQPVYQLLGQQNPMLTKSYSGMIYFDELDPKAGPVQTLANGMDNILENCASDYKLGYRQFKLKIGRGNMWMPKEAGLQRDIDVTKLVAKTFPDCEILVDANDGYTVDSTIAYLKGIGDIPLFWMEEPFAETVADYRKLRAWTRVNKPKTLLADGEYDPDQTLLRELCEQKLIDVHITDIMGYGFTPWRKLMPELKKMGIQASPHAFGEVLKTNYIAHLTGALGNTVTIEGVPCTSDDIDFGDYKIVGGQIVPSPAPGFGMKLLKTA
ncbi:mandelate racemase/muconate lactonizing protein [Fibrisoma limi BUZ 3]|uniref:Mandelate racemase/muconate lactonizing protein n=1 Tax=Fibrisoma limi BUZ 3 TaxID=1185876 RepID=I2GJ65_9BACT|nr:enolase C-terminal domain-like protein [Fibrisoma limi]CCH53940.1 mandelate racemase/muconate lactonizing protein [Fibrisoma limi BUZ 3]